MTQRRKLMFLLLVPLFGVFLLGPGFGAAELVIWLTAVIVWLAAFAIWGSGKPRTSA